MNETEELLELLRIMKDLHGNGFHLTKEINAAIRVILVKNGVTKELVEKTKINN